MTCSIQVILLTTKRPSSLQTSTQQWWNLTRTEVSWILATNFTLSSTSHSRTPSTRRCTNQPVIWRQQVGTSAQKISEYSSKSNEDNLKTDERKLASIIQTCWQKGQHFIRFQEWFRHQHYYVFELWAPTSVSRYFALVTIKILNGPSIH